MRDIARKSGKRKKNEDGDQMKQWGRNRKGRGAATECLGEITRGDKGPRRTVCKAKARTRTEETGGEKETGGAENRRDQTTSRNGQKER